VSLLTSALCAPPTHPTPTHPTRPQVKASVSARQDAGVLGEGAYTLRKSFSYHGAAGRPTPRRAHSLPVPRCLPPPPFPVCPGGPAVMNACPVGLWGFFGLTPDREEPAWRRFVFEGRVWLRCTIDECH
jgi:hypothetical protein